jgi:hypothetical protein
LSLLTKIRKYRDRKFNDGSYLVYSMGKVGSSSVEASLKERLPDAVVFHTHFLSDNWLNEILPKEKAFFHGNIHIGKKIRAYLDKNEGKRIRIITLVRDPLIREMSGIFENWQAHYEDIDKVTVQEITDKIDRSDFKFCFNWFDTEFKEFTGFNIYAVPFNKEKGFSIYQHGKFEILCMQLEKLDSVFSVAMEEFTGMKISLKNANIATEKKGNELYKNVKKSYKLSEAKSDFVYGSSFVKHFYTDNDISKMKSVWI